MGRIVRWGAYTENNGIPRVRQIHGSVRLVSVQSSLHNRLDVYMLNCTASCTTHKISRKHNKLHSRLENCDVLERHRLHRHLLAGKLAANACTVHRTAWLRKTENEEARTTQSCACRLPAVEKPASCQTQCRTWCTACRCAGELATEQLTRILLACGPQLHPCLLLSSFSSSPPDKEILGCN